jgi:hypothetical protein
MATISYNLNIPAANNNPSTDQPLMQTNTNAINTLLNIDHFGFKIPNGGWHQQSTYVDSTLALGTPITITTGQAAIYAKKNKQSQIMATSDSGANEYQLTRFIDAQFTLFGTNTLYQPANGGARLPAVTGGWTFLPGQTVSGSNAMLLQYGIATDANLSRNYQINFPVPFTSFCASVTLAQVRNNTDDKGTAIFTGSITTTGFQLEISSSDQPTSICWIAIGV